MNFPLPCLHPFWIYPSQIFPLLQMIFAYSNTPKLYRQFQYQVSDSASQNAFPLSSQCQGAHFLQLFFKYQSLKTLLNSQVDVSIPFPWYLLFFKLPLYSFPLMYLMIPYIRCPLKIPISVDYQVYLTPCPFLLPAQNSPQQTQCLKIYRP